MKTPLSPNSLWLREYKERESTGWTIFVGTPVPLALLVEDSIVKVLHQERDVADPLKWVTPESGDFHPISTGDTASLKVVHMDKSSLVLKVDNTFHTYFKAEKVAVSDLKHPTNFPSLLSDYFINKIWLLEEENPHEKEEPTAHQLTFQNLLFAKDTTYLTTPYYVLTRLNFSLNFFQIKEARDLDDQLEIRGWNYFVWEDYVVLTTRDLDRMEDTVYYFSLFSEKEVVLKGSQGAVISLRLME